MNLKTKANIGGVKKVRRYIVSTLLFENIKIEESLPSMYWKKFEDMTRKALLEPVKGSYALPKTKENKSKAEVNSVIDSVLGKSGVTSRDRSYAANLIKDEFKKANVAFETSNYILFIKSFYYHMRRSNFYNLTFYAFVVFVGLTFLSLPLVAVSSLVGLFWMKHRNEDTDSTFVIDKLITETDRNDLYTGNPGADTAIAADVHTQYDSNEELEDWYNDQIAMAHSEYADEPTLMNNQIKHIEMLYSKKKAQMYRTNESYNKEETQLTADYETKKKACRDNVFRTYTELEREGAELEAAEMCTKIDMEYQQKIKELRAKYELPNMQVIDPSEKQPDILDLDESIHQDFLRGLDKLFRTLKIDMSTIRKNVKSPYHAKKLVMSARSASKTIERERQKYQATNEGVWDKTLGFLKWITALPFRVAKATYLFFLKRLYGKIVDNIWEGKYGDVYQTRIMGLDVTREQYHAAFNIIATGAVIVSIVNYGLWFLPAFITDFLAEILEDMWDYVKPVADVIYESLDKAIIDYGSN